MILSMHDVLVCIQGRSHLQSRVPLFTVLRLLLLGLALFLQTVTVMKGDQAHGVFAQLEVITL
jgi:hypothetical protein